MHPNIQTTFSQFFPDARKFLQFSKISRILIAFVEKEVSQVMLYLRTNKTVSDSPITTFYRNDLKYVKILAILEFAILLAE